MDPGQAGRLNFYSAALLKPLANLSGLLLRPSATLERLKAEESLVPSLLHLLAVLLVFAVAGGTATGVILRGLSGAFAGFVAGLLTSAILLAGALLWGLWMHIWVIVFGGQGVSKTLRAMLYAFTPRAFLAWVPGATVVALLSPGAIQPGHPWLLPLFFGVGGGTFVWTFVLFAKATRIFHGLERMKAVLATFIGVLIPTMLGGIFVWAAILGALFLGAAPPATAITPVASVRLLDANTTHICLVHQGGESFRWNDVIIRTSDWTFPPGYEVRNRLQGDCHVEALGLFDLCPRRADPTGGGALFSAGETELLVFGTTNRSPLKAGDRMELVYSFTNKTIASLAVRTLNAGPALRCP